VVFDNWFETVHHDGADPPQEWEILVTHSRFQADLDEDDWNQVELSDDWLDKDELAEKKARVHREREERRVRATQTTPSAAPALASERFKPKTAPEPAAPPPSPPVAPSETPVRTPAVAPES
jgi:sRNA-binding protein